MTINIFKLLAPDFTLGKSIVLRKAIADTIKLLVRQPTAESLHFARLMLQVKPSYTMVTNKNLIVLYNLVQRANSLDLPGDIVECGVWNGGSAAVMGLSNIEGTHKYRNRTIWLFDSFQGLPPPTEQDGEEERANYFEGWGKGDVGKTKQVFARLGVPLDHVRIIPGWFDATLRTAPVDSIAILHIDADWYESVKLVLDLFYDKVVPGGFIILNDYGTWQGCNQALADYFTEHGISDVMITQVDPAGGAYFQKVSVNETAQVDPYGLDTE